MEMHSHRDVCNLYGKDLHLSVTYKSLQSPASGCRVLESRSRSLTLGLLKKLWKISRTLFGDPHPEVKILGAFLKPFWPSSSRGLQSVVCAGL